MEQVSNEKISLQWERRKQCKHDNVKWKMLLFIREVKATRKGEIYFKRLSNERLKVKMCG